jgi:hypothetical protein
MNGPKPLPDDTVLDRNRRIEMTMQVYKIWTTNTMLQNVNSAWLVLNANKDKVNLSKLSPTDKVAVNAVLSFFRKLRVLITRQDDVIDKALAADLFLEDTVYWMARFDRLTCDPEAEEDEAVLEWYRNRIRNLPNDLRPLMREGA